MWVCDFGVWFGFRFSGFDLDVWYSLCFACGWFGLCLICDVGCGSLVVAWLRGCLGYLDLLN